MALNDTCVHVLLVEDALDMREALVALLELHGVHVICAESAGEAIAVALRSDRIDLLVTDVHLPDGHGQQLAACLDQIRPGVPSLFISGDPPPPDLALGPGQAFLRKPAGIAAILGQIRALVGQSEYGRAS